MATVKITFEDRPDGTLGISGEFDPPWKRDAFNTPATEAGHALLQEIIRQARDPDETQGN